MKLLWEFHVLFVNAHTRNLRAMSCVYLHHLHWYTSQNEYLDTSLLSILFESFWSASYPYPYMVYDKGLLYRFLLLYIYSFNCEFHIAILCHMSHLPFLDSSSPSWLQMRASSLKLLLFCALLFAFCSSAGKQSKQRETVKTKELTNGFRLVKSVQVNQHLRFISREELILSQLRAVPANG